MIPAKNIHAKAYQRARQKRPFVGIIAFGKYAIFTSDSAYFVNVTKNSVGDDLVECDCPAAIRPHTPRPCYHAAAGYKKHLAIVDGARERNLNPALFDRDYLQQAEWLI